MKTFFLVVASFGLFTGSAHAAAPSCLKTVSNDDLMAEVALRMNSTQVPQASAIPTFSCNFKTLTVSLVEASTGTEQREDISLTDPSSCTAIEQFLSTRIGNRTLSRATMIAGCNFKTLLRVSLNPSGTLKRLQDQTLTDPSACNVARDRINDSN